MMETWPRTTKKFSVLGRFGMGEAAKLMKIPPEVFITPILYLESVEIDCADDMDLGVEELWRKAGIDR